MSVARTVAIALTGLIGVSGLGVGIVLIPTLGSMGGEPSDLAAAAGVGFAIGAGIAAYGLAAVAGAYGVWRGNRWGWWLATVTIVAGLIVLVRLTLLGGAVDQVFLGGAIVWGADLLALVAPGTRRSLPRGAIDR